MSFVIGQFKLCTVVALWALLLSPIFAQDAIPGSTVGTVETNEDSSLEMDGSPRDNGLRILLLDISTQHPRILERARELAALLAAANYKSSRYPDPGLGVAWSNYPYKKDLRLIDDQTPMTGIEITVSQPIPFPGRLTLESKIADVDASASRLRLAIEKNLIAREFIGTLLDAQSVHETIQLTRSFTERIKIVSEVANTRYAVGKGDLTDVSKAGVRYAAYRDRVRHLEGSLGTRYRSLLYYLDGSVDQASFEVSPEKTDPGESASSPTKTPELLASILAKGRDVPAYIQDLQNQLGRDDLSIERESLAVALASLEIDRQEKEKYLARMQYLPDFEVFASYRKRGNIPNDPAQDEDFMSFGFKMRVPLWSALSNHNNVEAKDEMEKSARFSERNIAEREKSMLDSARIDYKTLNERLVLYNESLIPQASQSVESARLAYENGRADFDTFLSSWDMLYNLEAERIRLRADRDKQVLLMAFILNVILPDHLEDRTAGDPS